MPRGRLLVLLGPFLAAGIALGQPALRLTGEADSLSLSGHLALLVDPGGTLGIEGARASDGWRALAGQFALGYTADAAWLRFEVERTPSAAATWLLRFDGTILDDVRLFVPDGAGDLREERSGEDVPRKLRASDDPFPLFRLHLPEGRQRLFVRIETRSSLTARVRLVRPERFEREANLLGLSWGLFYGVIAAIVVFQLLFWVRTREPAVGWYAAYVFLYAGSSVFTLGYPQRYFGLGGRASEVLTGVMICGAVGVGSLFVSTALELSRILPRFNRLLLAASLSASLVGAAVVAAGSYGVGVSIAQVAALVILPVFLGISAFLALRGHEPARILLVAFGLFFLGVLLRFLRNLGAIPPGLLADHGIHAGALANFVTVSLGLTGRFDRLKKEAARAQAEALEATRRLNDSLEAEVAARTAELTEEVRRRSALEEELRRALGVEREARAIQRDFVAMVSHEFRSPLTVIGGEAQLLRANPDSPRERRVRRYERVESATERMTELVEAYLSADRTAGDETALELAPSDLRLVIARAVADLPDGRVRVEAEGLPETFPCDPDLLEVALRNLLVNADRYSPSGSPVTLVARPAPDGGVVLEVTDEGPGIPPDELPRLFQKFFRGRGAQGKPGTGLGLYIVEGIVRRHGGSVSVESSPGAGTKFRLVLPGARAA